MRSVAVIGYDSEGVSFANHSWFGVFNSAGTADPIGFYPSGWSASEDFERHNNDTARCLYMELDDKCIREPANDRESGPWFPSANECSDGVADTLSACGTTISDDDLSRMFDAYFSNVE